ncbi:hypothetical protein ACHAPT_008503 [Fusarium lateritium]
MPSSRAKAAKLPEKDKFEDSLASKPFVFVIGEERKEFHVHKELIGQLSPVLNALVNGKMKEACEGRVEWLHVDVDTFVRFAKFAYSGDYTPAEPEMMAPVASEGDAVHIPTSEEQDRETIDLTSESDDDEGSLSALDDSSPDSSGGITMDGSSEDSSGFGDSLDSSNSGTWDSYSSSSEESSTLGGSRNRHMARQFVDMSINEYGIVDDCTRLPYSLQWYMDGWGECLSNYGRSRDDIRPHKRRRHDTYSGVSPPAPVNKKYDAMVFFTSPFGEMPPRSTLRVRGTISMNPNKSYRPVFLSHARLYILADMYGVESLRRIALCRLQRTLTNHVVHESRLSDLVALQQEIFDNTRERDHARTLIVDYFSCIIEDIRDSPEVIEALQRGGDFPAALILRMAKSRL